MKLLQIISLLLVLVTLSFGQTKIGFVDGYQFYDEKTGIKQLVEAVKLTYDHDFNTLELAKKNWSNKN